MAFRRRKAFPTDGVVLEDLNDSERAWVEAQLVGVVDLARSVTGDSEAVPALTRLDEMLRSWRARAESADPDINTLVSALGVTFGHHLLRRLGLRWVIAHDEQGTDLALSGQPGDILLYPANLVAKRVVAGEDEFFVPLFDAVCETVDGVRRQQG
jgi:Domain of unknown function (DUF3806)